MKVRKKIIAAVTALAAGAGAGLFAVQSASAATVTVNGELCTYTYTQADADYLNVAADAIESIEKPYHETDWWYYSYFPAASVAPGESVVKTVGDAQNAARWDEYYGVEWDVDWQIDSAKSRAVTALNGRGYDADDALLLASWWQNSHSRDDLLHHEIDKACASGGSAETPLPKDPSFSPDKFPQWDLGEVPEEEPSTTGEPTPTPEPDPTPTPTPSPDPTPTPTPSPGEVEQGSAAGSSDDDTDGLSPLLAVGGLVALIGVLVAVAPFLAPQLQAFLP